MRVEFAEKGGRFVFSIFHTGFHRIKGDRIDHVRQFRLGVDSLDVDEDLRGTGAHTIEAFFHLATGAEKFDFQHSAGDRKVIQGWTSPCYGVKIPSTVFVVRNNVQLPVRIVYDFQW